MFAVPRWARRRGRPSRRWAGGGGPGEGRLRSDAADPEIEVAAHFADDGGVDRLGLRGEAPHQRVVGQDVDDARQPVGNFVNGEDGVLGEDLADVAAGDAQPSGDVGRRLLQIERRQLRPQRDALLQLAQRLLVEAIGELGLADEHQVEELDRRRLDVGEQPDLFEQLVGQALRLVDDQRRQAAGGVALVDVALELGEEARLGLGAALVQAEASRDELVELLRGSASGWSAGRCGSPAGAPR